MRYEIEGKLLSDIGDAIREKTGKSELILPGDMPEEITGISSGDVIEYKYLPYSNRDKVFTSVDYNSFIEGNNHWGQFYLFRALFSNEQFAVKIDDYIHTPLCNYFISRFSNANDVDVTVYLVAKFNSYKSEAFFMALTYYLGNKQSPHFSNYLNKVNCNVYGSATIYPTSLSPLDWHVYTIAIDSLNKIAYYYIDSTYITRISFAKCGSTMLIGCGGTENEYSSDIDIKYAGIVNDFENESTIINNHNKIMNELDINISG